MADDLQSWVSAVAGQAEKDAGDATTSWVNGVLDREFPHRTVPRNNGVFVPRSNEDFSKLPPGAVYQVPPEWRAGPSQVGGVQVMFRSTRPETRESPAFRIRGAKPAAYGRSGALGDEPVDVEFDPASNEWRPKSARYEEHQARVQEAETRVSGSTLGRIGQQFSIGYTNVTSLPFQMFMDEQSGSALAERGATHDQAVAENYNVGWTERNFGGVARSVGSMAAVAPLGIGAAWASPFVSAGGISLPVMQQEYKRARDKGLSQEDAGNHAILQFGSEFVIASLMSSLGFHGMEGAFKAMSPAAMQAAKASIAKMGAAKFLAVEMTKRGGAEVAEELLTKRAQDIFSEIYGIRTAESKTWQSWLDTATQAFLGGSIVGSPGAFGAVSAQQQSKAADLKGEGSAAKWATENPDAAAALAAKPKPTRGDVARATGTKPGAWSKGKPRTKFVDDVRAAVNPQTPAATQPQAAPNAAPQAQATPAGRVAPQAAPETPQAPVTPVASPEARQAELDQQEIEGLLADAKAEIEAQGRSTRAQPTVPVAPPTQSTPPAAPPNRAVAEGGVAYLANGSRVAFGQGAMSENGDIVVPGKAGKPGRTIPASAISRIESTDGRSVWRRPPHGVVSDAPSSGAAPAPSVGSNSSPQSAESPAGSMQERREAARARLAAAEAELRRLNVGLGSAPVAGTGLLADESSEPAFAFAKPAPVATTRLAGEVYDGPQETAFFAEVSGMIGFEPPGKTYRVVVSEFSKQFPFVDVIDDKVTIVVGRTFMEEHPAVRQVEAAHELVHVGDILRLGIDVARGANQTSRAAVELSVQNRAMGKLMDYYEKVGQPIPDEAMKLHMDYLYGEGGCVKALANELNE